MGAWWGLGPKTWMSPELAQPGSAAGRKHSHWGNRVEQRATCEEPISIHCISMERWIAELRVFFPALIYILIPLFSPLNFRWLVHIFFSCVSASSCVRDIPLLQSRSFCWCIISQMYCYIFHLFKEVQDLVCAYALVESVPLLACGLFHSAPIHDVTSFPEWVICPGSSQRNKLVGIKVPLILFPGGWIAFLDRNRSGILRKSASDQFLLEKSWSRPEFKCEVSPLLGYFSACLSI